MSLTPKDPDVFATYTIDWRDVLFTVAPRNAHIDANTIVIAQRDTGFFYEATAAGRTAQNYPRRWPRASNVMVDDGSVLWMTRHPDDVTENAIASAVWDVPSGITLVSQDESGTLASIVLSGGTDGVDYELTCRMTATGGAVEDKTIIIQVRSQ